MERITNKMDDKKWRQLKWNWTYCAYVVCIHSNYTYQQSYIAHPTYALMFSHMQRTNTHTRKGRELMKIMHRLERSIVSSENV